VAKDPRIEEREDLIDRSKKEREPNKFAVMPEVGKKELHK
jgi:hypothetical protein